MDAINKQLGEKVTLKRFSSDGVNKWGDEVNETVEEETVKAVVEVISADTSEESEGDVKDGQLNVYVDDCVDVSEGDVFVWQGDDYQVDEIEYKYLAGDGHYEVTALTV